MEIGRRRDGLWLFLRKHMDLWKIEYQVEKKNSGARGKERGAEPMKKTMGDGANAPSKKTEGWPAATGMQIKGGKKTAAKGH